MTNEVPAKKPTALAVRLALATMVGVGVAAMAVYVGWQELRTAYLRAGGNEQQRTVGKIDLLKSVIESYRSNKGTFPKDFAELVSSRTAASQSSTTAAISFADILTAKEFLDGWDRPLIYERRGDDYEVRSLGRDGKPGGIGLDYDLSSSPHPWYIPPAAWPTLKQFVFEMPTQDWTAACVGCGGLAFILTLVLIRRITLTPLSLLLAIIKIAVTGLAALILASLMTFHHIKLGH